MKILVTGSEGLIGRPIRRMLQARGDEVERYDIGLSRDVLRADQLDERIAKADAVIHLAAQSGVEKARANPGMAWALNVFGTLNALESCRRHDKPIVVASSNHIYGNHGGIPTAELAAQRQLDTYSATKVAADLAARSYAHNYGLRVAIVRNTNCFGPDSPHFDHIVEGTIRSYLKGEAPVLWTDGKRVKSYLYVDDVAEAYIAALGYIRHEGAPGEAFNITGERISVLDLVRLIAEVMGTDLQPIVQGKPNDQFDENLDDSKARRVLGWRPRHSLREAVALTVEGMRARVEMQRQEQEAPA